MTADGAPPAAGPDAPFRVGAHVGGRYAIIRFIAAGGMGEVYEAEDKVLGTRVALKAVKSAGSPGAVERLKREIALARKVTHPSICRVHDVGEHAGRAFLTMELLAGETLADRLRGGALDDAEVARIAPQLVAALGALHAAGIVHRDFKSSNIVLDGDRVVVTDFGLARSEDGADARLTTEAAMLGTPAYMAPEQVEGREATAASDIYALGVVLYEMTTGRLPFAEDTPLATATARLTKDPPIPATSPRWKGAILRCLERAPADRPRRVEDVLGSRRRRRRRGLLLVAAALAAGTVVAGVQLAGDDGEAAAGACPSGASRLQGIWDPATRARIGARFEASDADHVHDSWRAISAQLDGQSAAWIELWDRACAAPDREDDPLLHAQRLTCADHRLIELRAHADLLDDPTLDHEALSLGFSGGFLLQDIADCASVELLRAQPPAPAAKHREAITALMLEYHRARVRLRRAVNAGLAEGIDDAFGTLDRIQGELLDRGYPTGAAEVAWWYGRYAGDLLPHDDVVQRYDEAIAIADQARDDVMLIWALAGKSFAAARNARAYDPAAVEAAIARAEGLLSRVGNPASARANLAEAKAMHALRMRRPDELLAAWTEARLAMEASGRAVDAHTIRGATLGIRSWLDDPRELTAEARAIAVETEALLGPSHLRVADVLLDMSKVHYRAGDLETARRDVDRAISIYERALGSPTSPFMQQRYFRAFLVARAQGRDADAARHLETLVAIPNTSYAFVAALAAGEGEREAAEHVARLAIERARSPIEKSGGYEELADLTWESGAPFEDAPWEARLADAPVTNRYVTLAVIAARQGNPTRVTEYIDQLRAITGHPDGALGYTYLELGEPAKAIAPLRSDRDYFAAVERWDHPVHGDANVVLGLAHFRSGDRAGAIDPLEQGLWVMGVCCGARSVLAQDARFALARALWDTGGDRERARALATEAHRALAAMGPSLEQKAAEIAAWLEDR